MARKKKQFVEELHQVVDTIQSEIEKIDEEAVEKVEEIAEEIVPEEKGTFFLGYCASTGKPLYK